MLQRLIAGHDPVEEHMPEKMQNTETQPRKKSQDDPHDAPESGDKQPD